MQILCFPEEFSAAILTATTSPPQSSPAGTTTCLIYYSSKQTFLILTEKEQILQPTGRFVTKQFSVCKDVPLKATAKPELHLK